MTGIEERWASLEPGRGFTRVDETHPLDFYIGVDSTDRRLLLLVTEREPRVPTQSEAVQVYCRQRRDNRWALVFSLSRPELGSVFSYLCEDLVESSRQISDKSIAGEIVMNRFDRWQRLLRSGNTGLLDESAQKGLIGELLFMRDFALPAYGAMNTIEGWTGPLSAEHDFRFVDGIFEIKTIGAGALGVKISSEEQLDDCDRQLQLVVVVLENRDSKDENAVCLSGLVNELREELKTDHSVAVLFEDRLLSVGYLDREEYGVRFFRLERFRHFAVRDGFPRIVRSQLPSAVHNVRYEIDLRGCLPFEIVTVRRVEDGTRGLPERPA
jgi:hypothetical protein